MSLSRRKAIALLGGGAVLAATGAGAAYALTRTPTRALAPWAAAGGYEDPRLRALSYAILAPNPHNLQPWMAELAGSDALVIHRDPARGLPETDPFDRQITIGLGCFLELLRMAAAETGHRAEADLFPEGEGGPVAHLRLVPGAATPDPLFAHVLDRRSCKEAFEARPVPAEAADALSDHAAIVTDPEAVAALRDVAVDAWYAEAANPATHMESVHLLRVGRAEIEANPDGIDLGGPMFDTLRLLGMTSPEALADHDNPGNRQAIEGTADAIRATPAFAVVTTPGNARTDQIEVGRRWLRLNLATTGLGLSLHPVSQCLQEFAAVAPFREAAHAMLARPGETVQMLGRLGYGPAVARTPRWPLEAKLVEGSDAA